MQPLTRTPQPPYYAVLFTSVKSPGDDDGYDVTADRMVELAAQQSGFLGVESARNAAGVGITVSYWASEEAIRGWYANAEHRLAQQMGRAKWYQQFELRVCRVERAYGYERKQ
jgi:heme-degrading monooxygenase HmoA